MFIGMCCRRVRGLGVLFVSRVPSWSGVSLSCLYVAFEFRTVKVGDELIWSTDLCYTPAEFATKEDLEIKKDLLANWQRTVS